MKRPLNRLSTKQLEKKLSLLKTRNVGASRGAPFDPDLAADSELFEQQIKEINTLIHDRRGECVCGFPYHPNVPCEELGPQSRLKKDFSVTQDEMDDIYNFCDDCFRKGEFNKVDALLEELSTKISFMPPDYVFCYLTVTLCAANNLPSRKKFYEEATTIYKPELLQGLKI